jgi:hypothetical protein
LSKLRAIANILAIAMVFLLGAVSAHSEEYVHTHGDSQTLVAERAADSGASGSHHDSTSPSVHCGVPILVPSNVCDSTQLEVVYVSYFSLELERSFGLVTEIPRPPRG